MRSICRHRPCGRINDPYDFDTRLEVMLCLPANVGQRIVLAANFDSQLRNGFEVAFRRFFDRKRFLGDEQYIGRQDAIRAAPQFDCNFRPRLAMPFPFALIL
jgi:hypothetical protein